jgi:glycosyltransferase involved in cell wall biosynthesis
MHTKELGYSAPSGAVSAGFAILIPAYRPGHVLIDVIRQLASGKQEAIVVVDDGSGPAYSAIFEELGHAPEVHVIRQPSNRGKGSALKCGIAYILRACPEIRGIVTVDADGQHDPADVRKVCARFEENPDALVLGARSFGGSIPRRSEFGNRLARRVMRTVLGHRLSDSQTGLRAIPAVLLRGALKMRGTRYEFELETLIAAKHMGVRILEESIRTIYEPGNPSSHFHPFRDSMRIGYVLLRFSMIAILSAILDNLVFYFLFRATGSIIGAQIGARIPSIFFNYTAVKRAVFLSEEPDRILLPRYLLLVAVSGCLSYTGITVLTSMLPVNVLLAKVIVETLLFTVNLTIQREWVFTKRRILPSATDWDRYYRKVPFTARLTRKYTQSVLISAMKRHINWHEPGLGSIVELGGANSCFLDSILKALRPHAYHVVDRNEFGLSLLRRRFNGRFDVTLHQGDVLNLRDFPWRADCVFSVGLIEHFDPNGTRKAIGTHFDLLRYGGCAIISFPTPTGLYKIARAVADAFGLWHFPDERPLPRDEVMDALRNQGTVLFEKTLWPLIFTQHFVVVRKPLPTCPHQPLERCR